MNIKNISGGFKASGIYPFNKKAITIPKPPMKSLPEQSGLKYIPQYSPANRGTRHLSEQCISFPNMSWSYLKSNMKKSMILLMIQGITSGERCTRQCHS